MRVIATKVGFFDYLRRAGEEFEVPDGTKGSWFKPVEVAEPEKPAPRARKAAQQAETAADDPASGLT